MADPPDSSSSTPSNARPPGSPTNQNTYAPTNPSQLREGHFPPSTPTQEEELPEVGSYGPTGQFLSSTTSHDFAPQTPPKQTDEDDPGEETFRRRATDGQSWDQSSVDGSVEWTHGSISPRATSPSPEGRSASPTLPYSHRSSFDAGGEGSPEAPRIFSSSLFRRDRMKHIDTEFLDNTQGFRHSRLVYLYYYIPFFNWIKQYRLSFLFGDVTAAFTMASFYIPMALSYSSNLAHIPAINGLYAFAFNPLIYALLGSTTQMVVGPEAAGSLLTGNVVRENINKGHVSDEDGVLLSKIAGTVTGVAGAILLIAGVARLGFLDNVLSRPFLRGFISALGFVIIIDQFIQECGLSQLARDVGVTHGSSIDKIVFLGRNLSQAHKLTCAVSFGSFAIIMICREIKRRLQPRYPGVAYVPDRFVLVVVATIMSWKLRWDKQGVSILGDVRAGTAPLFSTHMPFDFSRMKHLETALGTAFVISLLGFFESSVAAKSLPAPPKDGIKGVTRGANRELIALGTANIIGGVFMAIPAFGGYGRSKVNVATGGKTAMSNIVLSLITFLCIFFILPGFYYIPKGVLSAMVSVVAWSLIEEAPHDLRFFWKIRGWVELFLIFFVFITTILYSIDVGIACGIGFSLLRVIKHSTRPRIQILGKARDSEDVFENAEADPDRYQQIEGCLIVKIPEPLTFANTGDLKNRLRRLEEYGTNKAHPALPRRRPSRWNMNIIFDIHGVTSLDGAGAQVLAEILQGYKDAGTRIIFCRVPHPRSQVRKLFESSGIVEICGGPRHFVNSVKEALRLTKIESVSEEYRDDPDS